MLKKMDNLRVKNDMEKDGASGSVRAIGLARKTLEAGRGNFGLMGFSLHEVKSMGGKKYLVICSFFESIKSVKPSFFKVVVDLTCERVEVNIYG